MPEPTHSWRQFGKVLMGWLMLWRPVGPLNHVLFVYILSLPKTSFDGNAGVAVVHAAQDGTGNYPALRLNGSKIGGVLA